MSFDLNLKLELKLWFDPENLRYDSESDDSESEMLDTT